MNNRQKFEKFLESLKGNKQDTLIESIKEGFQACFEQYMMGEQDVNIMPIDGDTYYDTKLQFLTDEFRALWDQKDSSDEGRNKYFVELSNITADILEEKLAKFKELAKQKDFLYDSMRDAIYVDYPNLGDGPLSSWDVKGDTAEELIQKTEADIDALRTNPREVWGY